MSTEKRTKVAKEGKNMLAEEKFQKYPTMAEVRILEEKSSQRIITKIIELYIINGLPVC